MGLMKENPRYNVVSLRISDEEKEALDEVARSMNRSISEVMREAMEMFQDRLMRGDHPF